MTEEKKNDVHSIHSKTKKPYKKPQRNESDNHKRAGNSPIQYRGTLQAFIIFKGFEYRRKTAVFKALFPRLKNAEKKPAPQGAGF